MPKGNYPRKRNYNGIPPCKSNGNNVTSSREEIRDLVLDFLEKKVDRTVNQTFESGVLVHLPDQSNPFFIRNDRLYKKRYTINMKKITVPCSCGLEHAVLWQVMTPTEIQERDKVEQVKENNITVSMTDMFFQKPLEPKWESFENMFWSGFRKLFKIR